jgi:hypothetical protein
MLGRGLLCIDLLYFRWASSPRSLKTTTRCSYDRITSNHMAFIVDWHGNSHQQDPKPYVQEEEQPPFIYVFLAGLEDAMEAGPVELDHHKNATLRKSSPCLVGSTSLTKLSRSGKIYAGPMTWIHHHYPTMSCLDSQTGSRAQRQFMPSNSIKLPRSSLIGPGHPE